MSSSGKITTICPEGNRNVFMSWLNALRDIIGKLNLERYRRTRDREYRRDVSAGTTCLLEGWMIRQHINPMRGSVASQGQQMRHFVLFFKWET